MELLLKRTHEQEAADTATLAEAGVIEAARKAEAAARRAAGTLCIHLALRMGWLLVGSYKHGHQQPAHACS